MKKKQNCWEYKKCGREPGGYEAAIYDVCSAATSIEANGLNDGINGGRICWAVAGTFLNGNVTAKYASDKFSCINCDFFQLVSDEQGVNDFEMVTPLQLSHFRKKHTSSCSELIEKRSCERFITSLNAAFQCNDSEYIGEVTNISETGMFISICNMSFPNEAQFQITLDTHNKHLDLPVRMSRLTISPDLDDGIGVEILNPPQSYLILVNKLRTKVVS